MLASVNSELMLVTEYSAIPKFGLIRPSSINEFKALNSVGLLEIEVGIGIMLSRFLQFKSPPRGAGYDSCDVSTTPAKLSSNLNPSVICRNHLPGNHQRPF